MQLEVRASRKPITSNDAAMNQELPKFHETFIPILDILSSGESIHYKEMRKRVLDKYYADLPESLLDLKTKSGDPLILNRIGWGRVYLKVGKFVVQPERAMVQITEKGRNALEKGALTLAELKKDPD